MKIPVKIVKKIKYFLPALFVALILFSPGTSNAVTEQVTGILNSHNGDVIWVTQSKLAELLGTGEWSLLGSTQSADSSNIVDGIVKNGVIANPGNSGAGWLASLAGKIAGYIVKSILAVIYLVLWVIYSILWSLTSLCEKILEIVLDPTFVGKEGLGGFTTKDFVRSSAQLLANLCNMLYLFVLIYIAIKAMFGSSNTRILLIKLVIAALLTNFGLVLAGVVIDFSQVIMYTVWDGIKGSGGNFNPGTQILDRLQAGFGAGRPLNQIDSFFGEAVTFLSQSLASALTEITKIAGLIVISLALIITLVTITVIMTIRIIVLWILLILTPVAFLFSILPQTEKYWSQWLESLTKYAFTGPILVFFLWLAIKLSGTVTNASRLSQIGTNIPGVGSGDLKYFFFELLAKNMTIILEMITVVVTIWAGILIANQFGIKGAKSIDGLINSTMRLPGYLLGGFGYAMGVSGRLNQWTMKWRQDAREKQYEKLNKEMVLAEKHGQPDTVESKKAQMKELKKKMESKDKWMMRMRKGFALATPQTLKKEFAKVWNQSKDNYYEESEASLREFARDAIHMTTGRKRRDEKLAANNAEYNLRETNDDIQELKKKYRAETDPKKQEDIEAQILSRARGIVDMVSEGEEEKEKEKMAKNIKDEIMKKPDDANFVEDYVDPARQLAPKKRREVFWQSIELKEEREKKVKKADEFIDKLKLTPEQMVAMIRRGDGDRATQVALLRRIAASGKYFGDLMQKMIKNFDTDEMARQLNSGRGKSQLSPEELKRFNRNIRKLAIEELKRKTSENDVLAGMRAANDEGRKSHNLATIGYAAFDPVTGGWREAHEEERVNALEKYVKDMRPIEFNQIHVQTFEDKTAREALAKSGKWVGVANNERLVNDLKESISDNFIKYKQEFHDNIPDPKDQAAFDRVVSFKENPSGGPYKAP